jgi:uncharacterized membrane protein
MSFNVNIDLGYALGVKASAKDVFDVLSDIPTSVSFFPKVKQLVDLGDGAYRWEMDEIGEAPASLKIIYASRYVSDRAQGTVVWTPIPGEGNALVSGRWLIRDLETSTHLELQIKGGFTLSLPGLMEMMVTPVVEAKFRKLTQQYIDNLTQRFDGKA